METVIVEHIMSENIVTLNADENLDLAQTIMNLARVRHLPVVDGNKLVGIISHRDLLRTGGLLVEADPDAEKVQLSRLKVRQVMRSPVHTVTPCTSLLSAATFMVEHKVGCLPVVKQGTLVGIITESDFVELVVKSLRMNEKDMALASMSQDSASAEKTHQSL